MGRGGGREYWPRGPSGWRRRVFPPFPPGAAVRRGGEGGGLEVRLVGEGRMDPFGVRSREGWVYMHTKHHTCRPGLTRRCAPPSRPLPNG